DLSRQLECTAEIRLMHKCGGEACILRARELTPFEEPALCLADFGLRDSIAHEALQFLGERLREPRAVLGSIRRAELEGRVLFEAVDVEFGAHVVAHAFLLADALPQSRISGIAEYRCRDTHRRIVGGEVV